MTKSTEMAHDLAIAALAHIAADSELTAALLGGAGMQAQDLRRVVNDPDMAVFVLDFILDDDHRVIEFAREQGIRPENVMKARQLLAGPGAFGWEVD